MYGIPAPSHSTPWSLEQKDAAIAWGPHLFVSKFYSSFLLEGMMDYVHMGYWIVLPYHSIHHFTHLKVVPTGVVPQQ
jgi:hypothetical protein